MTLLPHPDDPGPPLDPRCWRIIIGMVLLWAVLRVCSGCVNSVVPECPIVDDPDAVIERTVERFEALRGEPVLRIPHRLEWVTAGDWDVHCPALPEGKRLLGCSWYDGQAWRMQVLECHPDVEHTLGHEVWHGLLWVADGDADGDHSDPSWGRDVAARCGDE